MAVDLKIETFSYDLFRCLYETESLKPPKERHYQVLSGGEPDNSELIIDILRAVLVRENFYFQFNLECIENKDYGFSGWGTDLYMFLQNTICQLCLPYLNIFDEILSIYALCYTMAKLYCINDDDIYTDTLPLCCVMYIDTELKDKFYGAGGWNEFKRYTSTYARIPLYERQFQSDIENAVDVLLRACSNYDLNFIRSCVFAQLGRRINESKLKNTCLKCDLLFGAFTALKNSYDYSASNIKFIEGILQVMLCIPPPFGQAPMFQDENLNASHEITYVSQSLNVSQNSNSTVSENNLDTEITKMRIDEENKIEFSDVQKILTREFLRNLFANFDDENVEIKPGSCSFCYQSITELVKSSEEKSLNEVKTKVLKCHSISDFEYNNKIPENHRNELEAVQGGSPSLCERLKNLTISETKQTPRIPTYEKNILRLFFALGIEPIKSLILSDFNANGDLESKKENITQNQITVENTPKIKRKQKKRKSKEKSHKEC